MFVFDVERKGWTQLHHWIYLLLALGALNRRGWACRPPSVCLPTDGAGVGEEQELGRREPGAACASRCTHKHHAHTHFCTHLLPFPLSLHLFPPSLLPPSPSPLSSPTHYLRLYLSGSLSISLLPFSPLLFFPSLSSSLPPPDVYILFFQQCLHPHPSPSPSNAHTHTFFILYFYCFYHTFSLLRYTNTNMLQLPTVFGTVTYCTGLYPRSNRLYTIA